MKGIILFVLIFISTAFSTDYLKQVNGSNFNLDGVKCHAKFDIFHNPYNKFITIDCDNDFRFSASVYDLASDNVCQAQKYDSGVAVTYSQSYKGSDPITYEHIIDEFGIDISVKKVYIDCVDIYKKFKSRIVGKVRTVENK